MFHPHPEISADLLNEAASVRSLIAQGQIIQPADIERWTRVFEPLRDALLPLETAESLHILSIEGKPTGLLAPRWLHHLLGIPHACAHGLIEYAHPRLGKLFLLQVRSWSKSDSPGHLDISFAGHLKGLQSIENAALEEMREEIGLLPNMLESGLSVLDTYFYQEAAQGRPFWNTEWVTLYHGTLKQGALDHLKFMDGEVAGIYLCPQKDLSTLFSAKKWPIAAGLRGLFDNAATIDAPFLSIHTPTNENL